MTMNRPPAFLLSLLFGAFLGSTGFGQNVALSEDFSTGVPPAGWVATNNNGSSSKGWIPSTDLRAWHEDEALSHGGLTSDDSLVTPVLDLSTFTEVHLHFANDLGFADYLANHPNSRGDGENNVEVSTDGGLSWTLVWTETRTLDGLEKTHVDLGAYAGMSNVQIAFRYYGTWAQEWWLDDVVVDDQDGVPVFTITNLVAGQIADLQVENVAPFATVLIGYSTTGAGPTMTPYGLLDMSQPITLLSTLTADAAGVATDSASVPVNAAGITVYAQSVELPVPNLSNSLAITIL